MPASESRKLAAVAAIALAIGFGGGYVAATERARQISVPAPAHVEMGHVHASEMPARPKGHTFTGNVDVPPHGELGHTLAARVLGEVQCPCGGCEDMSLQECGCDVAKEAEGVAAHLFERGKNGAEVLTQLGARYGFEVPPPVLARAQAVGAPHGSDVAPAKSGFLELGVDRPLDIPTGARPKP